MSPDHSVNDLLADTSFRSWVLSQDATAAAYWESWLQQHPEKKETLVQAIMLLKALEFEDNDLTEEESKRLLRRIKNTNAFREKSASSWATFKAVNPLPAPQPYKSDRKMPAWLAYAAILALSFATALSVHLLSADQKKSIPVPLVEKVNQRGQKARFYLPDGSRVVLNASSTLRYPKEFREAVRDVYLEGEAFFEVNKSNKPFVVHTNKMDASVLGTSFNVNAFPHTPKHTVSLVTGKLKVHASSDDQRYLILEPGEKGTILWEAGELIKEGFDYEEELAWKEGVLHFNNLPLQEAFSRMEQWYGVDFVVPAAPRDDYSVTGRFNNESLDNVLNSIGFTVKFNFKIEGKTVHITFHD